MPTLRELREKAFLTQEDVARKTDLSLATISRIENGHHKPMARTVKKLAKVLGVAPREIAFPEPQPKPQEQPPNLFGRVRRAIRL